MKDALTKIGRALLLVVASTVISSTCGYAADIRTIALPDGDRAGAIVISGPIVQGDAENFRKVAPKNGKILVALSGPGGSVAEALDIGSQIRTREWATTVVAGQGCYSACALIWLSGARRHFKSSSPVGFHAAYRIENGRKVETGMGNADIGAFLAHLGLEREAIQFISAAPPEDLSVLSLETARLLNIHIEPGEEDEFKWQLLRQMDMKIRASLLIVAGGGRCPSIRELKPAQRNALLSRLTPREGTLAFKYYLAKNKREMLKVLEEFDSTDVGVFCQTATRFIREAGFPEYLK